jgi:membrane protein
MAETEAVEPPDRITRFLRGPFDVARGVASALPSAIEDLFRDKCPQYAASIAYRVLFSLFPLTIVLVSIFGLILQEDDLRQSVIDELIDILPVSEEGQADVEQSIEGIASPLSAIGLISLIALLWGASGMMASIRIGLEAALKIDRGRPAAHAKLVDFVLVGVVGMLVLLVVGASIVGAFLSRLIVDFTEWAGIEVPSLFLVRDIVQLVVIGVTTLLLYRYVPAGKLRRPAALAGAIVTAFGIWGASKVLAILFDNFSGYNVIYGSLAGVMTFLFFVYVVALILLFGAEFAYAWSQPAGPPGPPVRVKVVGFLRGLFVHSEADDDEGPSAAPARRP